MNNHKQIMLLNKHQIFSIQIKFPLEINQEFFIDYQFFIYST
jgi:hypothetical protein